MSTHRRINISLASLACLCLLAACSAQPLSDADQAATRVAEDLTVSATLTAVAQSQAPSATAELAPATEAPAAPTELPAATSAPPEQATPTGLPIPPTAAPLPTEPPLAYTDVNFDGSPQPGQEVGGKIQIAGASFSGDALPLVRQQLAIRVFARFPNDAAADGDGVAQVVIRINNNETGETVHERTEKTAGYCAFGGGEPECDPWVFAKHKNSWPNGQPIANGSYTANIQITPAGSSDPTVFWNFQFAIELS